MTEQQERNKAKQFCLTTLNALMEFGDAFGEFIEGEANEHINRIKDGNVTEESMELAGAWITEALEHITEMQAMLARAGLALSDYQTAEFGGPDAEIIQLPEKKLILPDG